MDDKLTVRFKGRDKNVENEGDGRGESPFSSSFFLANGTRPPYAGPGAIGSDPPARENTGFNGIGVTGVGAEVLIGVIMV